MKNLLKASLVWTGILLSFSVWGQDIPLGALPMQYVGSFAGETGAPRLSLNTQYRSRNSSTQQHLRAYDLYMSYDQFIPTIRSGIGISAALGSALWQGPSYADNYERDIRMLSLSVAPKISIKGKYTLSPSVDLMYMKYSYEREEMINVSDRRGEGLNTRFGLLWNTPKYYIGYSMSGIRSYQVNGQKTSYELEYAIQMGYTFQKSAEADFSFTPQLSFLFSAPENVHNGSSVYRSSYDSRPLGFNLNFRYKKVIWGLNNAGIHLGIQNDRLRLMLTDNFGYLGSIKSYAGNLSFRYTFKENLR